MIEGLLLICSSHLRTLSSRVEGPGEKSEGLEHPHGERTRAVVSVQIYRTGDNLGYSNPGLLSTTRSAKVAQIPLPFLCWSCSQFLASF